MKPLLTTLAAMGILSSAHAQDPLVAGPKATSWLMQVQQLHATKSPTRHQVLRPPNTAIPSAAMDTLALYDWVEIGHLWFEEVSFSEGYGKPLPQYNFTRFHEDGTMNEYTAGPDSATGMPSIRYHAHNHPWQMTVHDTLGQSWLCYDPEDCLRIVTLHDQLLILDIDDGLASLGELDYPRRYRVVYMGVKKAF